MPTYLNNTTSKQMITGPRGETIPVESGESISVRFFTSDSNFTKTSDLPLYNRATATTSVNLGAAADHTLNSDTSFFVVTQITGSVTVKPQLDTATELLLAWTSEDPVILFSLDDHPCSKLRVSGTGTCTIMEYRY